MTSFTLYNMDCRTALDLFIAPESVDSVVTDPPYGLGFMGKAWDYGVPGVEFWQAAYAALKPGGHLLAFSGSRTYHRMVCAIEDAGFEIRDQIMWVYGSGFPKSLDVSKAIDKVAGAEREVVPIERRKNSPSGIVGLGRESVEVTRVITAPATQAAQQWQGWGTALKPAHEPICVARKPLIGTVAANVLHWGTGGLNIDACRVAGAKPDTTRGASSKASSMVGTLGAQGRILDDGMGRWPANLIHDGSDEVLAAFPETQAESAARFFYCAKANKKDRNEGLVDFVEKQYSHDGRDTPIDNAYQRNTSASANHHPTVKPTDLMQYLCRLVTPVGGTVLDPFMGSGSTGKAAIREGFKFIGCELDAEYTAIAHARITAEVISK